VPARGRRTLRLALVGLWWLGEPSGRQPRRGCGMPKIPKPRYWRSRQPWQVQIDGKRHNLGANRKLAMRRYHKLTAQPRQKVVQSDSVLAIVDPCLEWSSNHRAGRSYDWHRERLQHFIETVDQRSVLPAVIPRCPSPAIRGARGPRMGRAGRHLCLPVAGLQGVRSDGNCAYDGGSWQPIIVPLQGSYRRWHATGPSWTGGFR
jgi:hypothetical protein